MSEQRSDKALYVCIDGVDGSGKTTQVKMLGEHYEASGISAAVVPFIPIASVPLRRAAEQRYGTQSAMRVQFSREHVEYVHACEQYLNYQEHIAPKLETHDVVIQDRSKLSRLVNAKYAGTPLDDVEAILDQFPDPDATFYLHLAPATAFERLTHRGNPGKDETLEYVTTAGDYYSSFAQTLGAHIINAEQDPTQVHLDIVACLGELASRG